MDSREVQSQSMSSPKLALDSSLYQNQSVAPASPWSGTEPSPIDLSVPDNSLYVVGRSKLFWSLWYFLGAPLVKSYFLPFSWLKCTVLRAFGADVAPGVYIKPGVRVKFPWHLKIGANSWIGEDAWIDNLTDVTIGSNVCVSQGTYFCTGNHDWKTTNMKLFTRPIVVQDGAWIGARSTLCPGITVGSASILTVGSVATKNIPPFQVWSGTPAIFDRYRTFYTEAPREKATSTDPHSSKIAPGKYRQILGLRFFAGSVQEAVDLMADGGLLVAPAAPALKNVPVDEDYRHALSNADLVIADSGFMVLLWNLLKRDRICRLSGLLYLSELIRRDDFRKKGSSFWIMAGNASSDRNRKWLSSQGIELTDDDIYVAPLYGKEIEDDILLKTLRAKQPRNIVVTLGGGTQERLGFYLKRHLSFQPAIQCIGAAIAFLSGDQVRIPMWADALYLGWLFRCISEPRRYVSRYWEARKLLPLILKYRERPPKVETLPVNR